MFSVAQSSVNLEPKKIGLALSGGGAKGLAHIGLLKVMEEVGLTPDYITGTSMGSIIGGLYAIGYSADELERICTSQDWATIFSNDVDLRLVNMVEKDRYSSELVTLEYENHRFTFGQGLIKGQQLSLLLSRLASPAYNKQDFNSFPIPFKCIAVDILDGSVVELDSGFLAKAQRASMSIPFVFTPVEMDGHLLVDGGVIRNFPVEEVLEMGADLVIGAYTGRANIAMDDIKSALDVLIQTNFLYGIMDSERQSEKCDLYLDLSDKYSATDFDRAEEIIAMGEARARLQIDELRKMAIERNREINTIPSEQLFPTKIQIEDVDFSGVPAGVLVLVKRLLNLKPGKEYTFEEINQGVDRVYGTQFFKNVDYQLSYGQHGGAVVNLEVEKASEGTLSFGLHYNDPEKAGIILGARLNNLFNKAAVMSASVKVSESAAAEASLYQYIGRQRRWLYQFGLNFHKTDQFHLLSRFRPFEVNRFESFGGVRYLLKAGFDAELQFGIKRYEMKPVYEIDNDLLEHLQMGQFLALTVRHNSLDRNYFPNSGFRTSATLGFNYKMRYGDEFSDEEVDTLYTLRQPSNYAKVNFFVEHYLPLAPRVALETKVGIGFKTAANFGDNFLLGGSYFYRESGIPFMGLKEFRRSYRGLGVLHLGLRWNPIKKLYVTSILDIGKVRLAETSAVLGEKSQQVIGAGANIAYDSYIGPISLNIGGSSLQEGVRFALDFGFRFVF